MSGTFARPVVIRNRVAVSFRGRTFVLSPHGDYPGFWAVEANELCLSLHPPLGHSQTDVLNFGRERENCGSPPSLTTASTHYRSRDWEVSTHLILSQSPLFPQGQLCLGTSFVSWSKIPLSPQYDSTIPSPLLLWWLRPHHRHIAVPPSSLHPQSILHTTLEFPSWKRSDPWLPQPHCPLFFQLLTPPDWPVLFFECNCVPASGPLHMSSLCL